MRDQYSERGPAPQLTPERQDSAMKMFLMFLSLSLAACVAEPGAESEDTNDTSSSLPTEITETGSFTKAGPGTQSLTCYQIWYCRKCGINQRRNVLHEQCDDGSNTIIYTGPCGQACF